MIRRKKLSGLTLIELMIVVALGSVLGLGIMTLFYDTTKLNHSLRQQILLSENLESFFYSLEQYFSQTTNLIICNCSGAASTCSNPTLASVPAPAAGVVVLQAVYEDAADPLTLPGAGCHFVGSAGAPIAAVDGPIPYGCKKSIQLRYIPPKIEAAAVPSVAGRLALEQIDTAGAVISTVATLNNVTDFGCGMPTIATGALSNSEIILRIDVKARKFHSENPNDANYESWSPASAKNFRVGTLRSHTDRILFRNLVTKGVQFGKMRSYKNCFPNGFATANIQQCCSKLLNNAGTQCAASNTCQAPESLVATGVNCCSRMVNTAVCL